MLRTLTIAPEGDLLAQLPPKLFNLITQDLLAVPRYLRFHFREKTYEVVVEPLRLHFVLELVDRRFKALIEARDLQDWQWRRRVGVLPTRCCLLRVDRSERQARARLYLEVESWCIRRKIQALVCEHRVSHDSFETLHRAHYPNAAVKAEVLALLERHEALQLQSARFKKKYLCEKDCPCPQSGRQ